MQLFLSGALSSADVFALAWFFIAWGGYSWYSERSRWAKLGLQEACDRQRLYWARELLRREMRIPDAALVGNLMQIVLFYARTTIYIMAGLLAVLGTLDQAMLFAKTLPFAHESSRAVWEIKLILLLGIFIFAYFKFTWSMRQFNLLSIMIGASPVLRNGEQNERLAQRIGAINSQAGDEFNRGIRAYYFGLSAVAWFVQAWVFIAFTAMIVVILYRRDFLSPTLVAFRDEG